MTKETLQKDIEEIRAGLENHDVPESAKPEMRNVLDELLKKLRAMEEAEKEAPKPEQPTRSAAMAILDNLPAYRGFTRQMVNDMPEAKFKGHIENIRAVLEKNGVAKQQSQAWATYFLRKHLPAGETAIVKPKPADKKTQKPKPKTEEKTAKTRTLSVRQKVDEAMYEAAEPTEFCGLRTIEAPEDFVVEYFAKITKGERIIINDKRFFFGKMTGTGFKNVCRVGANTKEAKIQKLEAEKAVLEETVEKLKAELEKAKSAPSPTPKKEDRPAPNPATPIPSETKRKSPVKCTVDQAAVAELSSKIIGFLDGNTWSNGFSSKEVVGVYFPRKGEGHILVKIVKWSVPKKVTWYRICPKNFNDLRKVEPPKEGTYRRIVSQSKLKEIYTTKGPKVYKSCLEVYRSFYECSLKGKCTIEDKKKIKEAYDTCGDIFKKTQVVPKYMSDFNKEVVKRQKKGEKYHEAMSRVARELRGEE